MPARDCVIGTSCGGVGGFSVTARNCARRVSRTRSGPRANVSRGANPGLIKE